MRELPIPPRLAAILATIQAVSPDAFIGGGALRDLALGQPWKDVDVFVNPGFDLAKVDPTLQYCGTMGEELAEYEAHFDGDLAAVHRFVWDTSDECPFGTIAGDEVQVIEMARPFTIGEQLARFDFGACRAAWDGEVLWAPPEFWTDIQNRTLTYLANRDDAALMRSEERSARITERLGLKPVWPNRTPKRHFEEAR